MSVSRKTSACFHKVSWRLKVGWVRNRSNEVSFIRSKCHRMAIERKVVSAWLCIASFVKLIHPPTFSVAHLLKFTVDRLGYKRSCSLSEESSTRIYLRSSPQFFALKSHFRPVYGRFNLGFLAILLPSATVSPMPEFLYCNPLCALKLGNYFP